MRIEVHGSAKRGGEEKIYTIKDGNFFLFSLRMEITFNRPARILSEDGQTVRNT